MSHAEGTFELTGWDEKTHEEFTDGSKMTSAAIGQRFSGDLTGDGSWQVLMYYREDGTASIVGLERVEGSIGGHAGSFIVRTTGTFDGTEARSTWSVIPGSGTGSLRRLRGHGESAAPQGPSGTYSLAYELD